MAKQKVAMLTAGGLAPCLSSAVGGLIERYSDVAPDIELIAYRSGYQGLLLADRIEIARHLLTIDPTLKMTKLAETVGFAADEQYFSRIFRKLVGATPKQYAMGIADKQIIPHGRV